MGFDKAKAVGAAEKYLTQGKIASAVQEYQRIAEADLSDFTALNTLGDLYVRLDRKQEAIACFVRVADHYREQGFALKAIAIYKKVARLRPDEPGVALRLAALYEQQGLIVEARAQYMLIADSCERAGQPREALEALRRTADLDPQNIDIRLRLAAGFMRENMPDDAAEAYAEAGVRLHARGNHNGALKAFTTAHELRPASHEILQGVVDANLALGQTEEAATALEEAAVQTPGDMELRAMLVRVYLDAEDASAAERSAVELVSADLTNYPLLFEVARLYLQQGDAPQAVHLLTRTIEPALAKRQEKPLLEMLSEALARDPENIEALRLLLRIYTWQRDDDRMRIALERLAEAAQAQERFEEERGALEHLVRLVPFDQSYAERLSVLNELLGPEQAAAEPPQLETTAGAPPETPPAAPVFDDLFAAPPAHAPADDFAAPDVFDSNSLFESNSVADPFAFAPPAAPPPATQIERAGEFEWGDTPAPPAPADPSVSFAELNADFTDAAPSAAPDPAHTGFGEQEIHLTDPLDAPADVDAAVGDNPRAHAMLAQELESVDYYLAQGFIDIARDTLNILEEQYGAGPEINARRRQLRGTGPAAAAAPAAADSSYTGPVTFTDQPANAADTSNTPTPVAAAPAGPPPAASQSAAPTAAGGIHDAGLADFFAGFSDPAEDVAAAGADFETHYNTGLAYMEMGLLDMAIEEFQAAVGVVLPADGTPRYLQCCNLLGHCFMQKELPRAAIIWFKKGLATPGQTEDEYQALRYELGTAYERMGELDQAVAIFQEVYGIDVTYRSVADKLRQLQAQ